MALFYVFLCHYTTWCAYLAIAGFAMACDVFIEWSVDTMPVEFFAIFVAVWAVLGHAGDYVQRVEPSPQGGQKMAVALMDAIYGGAEGGDDEDSGSGSGKGLVRHMQRS